MGETITIVEYARRHGKNPASARQKAERGGFQTAFKLGRDWLIDEDEPYSDRRITTGRTIGYRQRRRERMVADVMEEVQSTPDP